MRALREKDYDEMAGRVVDRFLRGETKLADAAVGEAMSSQLNPDQIERLVQAANTMAFLKMMDARKAEGAPDMTHEFDPADTRSVLQSIIGQAPMSPEHSPMGMPHAEPDGDEGPLPDEMGTMQAPPVGAHDAESNTPFGAPGDDDGPFPKGEKQKSKDEAKKKDDKEPAKAPAKDEAKEAMVRERRLRKLAALLEDQYRQAELAFGDMYEKLTREFKVASRAPDFLSFEKDAMALDGSAHSMIVLNLLRQDRGMDMLNADIVFEKHAALADRHIVDDYPSVRLFEQLVKIAAEADRVRRGAEYARALCS